MKCLIVDKMHESLIPMLEEIGVKADYRPEIYRPEILDIIKNYQILIIRSKTQIDREFISYTDQLMVVGRAGAGIDNLDVEALEEKGISIINAPEGNRNAVAEHTLGMLLSILNNLNKGDREVRQGIWDREGNRGRELAKQTVGIIGYGFMGMAFARKLAAMECTVLAYDKYKVGYSDDFCCETDMDTLYREADIVSLHIPLTRETRYLADMSFFRSFKKPIIILNTSRGEILSLNDLLSALKEEKIVGAGLDVLENEKLAALDEQQAATFATLAAHPDILFSPHVAGWSFESYVRINTTLIRKLDELIRRGR